MEKAEQIAREYDLKLFIRELDESIANLTALLKQHSITAEKTRNIHTKALSLGEQGAALRESGKLKQAAQCYEEQAQLFRESGSFFDLQECLAKLAVIAMERGDGEQAIRLSLECEEICRDIHEDKALQVAMNLRSSILGVYAIDLENSGRTIESLQMLKEQEELCIALDAPYELQACLGLQARILSEQGKTDDAILLYERKRAICKAHGFDDGLIICLGNLGTVYMSRGEYQRGFELQVEAELVSRRIGQVDGLVMALANQAAIFAQAMNRVDLARPLIDEAMLLARQHSLASLMRQIEPVLRAVEAEERRK
jgi:tetratricopeptide (TPR) repeat protein